MRLIKHTHQKINLFPPTHTQKDAGHGAFNKARAIAAYSDATLRFTGGPLPVPRVRPEI